MMLGVLDDAVTADSLVIWLICALLVGYFIYKEWPEFKRRVSGGAIKDGTIIERLDKIEARLEGIDAKMQRDYDRINSLEYATKQQERSITESLEERSLMMHGILACLDGLQQQGCNHTVPETRQAISDYLNRQAHKS